MAEEERAEGPEVGQDKPQRERAAHAARSLFNRSVFAGPRQWPPPRTRTCSQLEGGPTDRREAIPPIWANCCSMLLTDCTPGRVVNLARRSQTFRAKVARTTPSGCVVLFIFLAGSRSYWPREVWARPDQCEPCADCPQCVEQTAPDQATGSASAPRQVERGCKSQLRSATV